ncbi:MAG: histidine kinase [Nocardia sp.]|uniref:sensor histidine kinase n=1 Tax=Nocardia sp. TaxID=1821 RepID=UPI002625A8FF|nr:sensor histidine kinase [Nocardia sp.]MCU1642392.1 histidine kinase [Nocardia sp.]
MSLPDRKISRAGRMTVQAWFHLVLALMVLVELVGTGFLTVATAHAATVSDRLSRQIQPAATEAYRLQGALANEETGVRGYTLTADPQFLDPYTQGNQDEARAAARLRELLRDHPELLADVDAVEQSAQAWRHDFADPLLATVTPGAIHPVDPVATARGKALFDDLRTHFATQNTNLAGAVVRDKADLDRKRTARDVALTGMVAAFLLTAVALTVLVRRLIVRPLSALENASLDVANGDFGRRITAGGPADLMAVGEAVEGMRRRIVAELDASRIKETLLAGQAADLDAQAMELRRSNAELEQFAYVASHDLQEPLRKVASFCQLLEKRYGDQLDERATQYIEFAVDGAKRMQVLINDLLTFSRVGRVSDHITRVEIDQTVDKAIANLASALEDTDVEVRRPDRLPEIVGDPTLLIMLWQNLVANAVKFRDPDRPPVVQIECEPEPGEVPGWRFSIADNGIGIASEFSDKVFVIFQRLHSRDEYSGTGIGLALCKKIVEFHGGQIWIDQEYTGGTRIVFTLFDAEQRSEALDKELPA